MVFGVTDERTIWQVIGVLTMFAWPPMVRLVRGAVREHLEYEHVLAARAMGARRTYGLRRHVIPHSLRFAEAPHLILPGFVLSLLVWALVRSGERLRAARVPK